jgi:hypothetical protein
MLNVQGLAAEAIESQKLLWKLRPKLHKFLVWRIKFLMLILATVVATIKSYSFL